MQAIEKSQSVPSHSLFPLGLIREMYHSRLGFKAVKTKVISWSIWKQQPLNYYLHSSDVTAWNMRKTFKKHATWSICTDINHHVKSLSDYSISAVSLELEAPAKRKRQMMPGRLKWGLRAHKTQQFRKPFQAKNLNQAKGIFMGSNFIRSLDCPILLLQSPCSRNVILTP